MRRRSMKEAEKILRQCRHNNNSIGGSNAISLLLGVKYSQRKGKCEEKTKKSGSSARFLLVSGR